MDAAVAFAALNVLNSNLYLWILIYLHLFVFFILCSVAVAMVSIIPKTIISGAILKETPEDNDNLLFYGHIAKYEPTEYLAAIHKRFGKSGFKPLDLQLDYARQIVINSQITLRKYQTSQPAN